MHKQQGWPQAWEYSQAKLIQTLGRASQGVDWSWSQCIKSHHTQTSSGKGLPSHFWTRDNVRSVLPRLWRKRTQWSKVLFSDESKICISFGNKVPDSGGRVERHRFHVAWSPVWSFHSQWWFGLPCHLPVLVHCVFIKSTVNAAIYQEILEHFMLPSADKLYGDADFIFQQDLAPAHTAKGTKSWFNDQWCYCAWLASKLVWPEPLRESMGYCQEEDERHKTQQCRWPEGRYQSNLGFHTTSAVPQTDYPLATPNWGSN